MNVDHRDHGWLYNRYVIDEMSTLEIGELCGVTSKRICAWLSRFDIPNRRAPISKGIYDSIRTAYDAANESENPVNLDNLSSELGHSKTTICRCARLLGLTNSARPKGCNRDTGWTESKIAFIIDNFRCMSYSELTEHVGFCADAIHRKLREHGLKKNISDVWKYRPHPRGMLGKHHSPDVCIGMSERMIQDWNDPDSTYNSEKFKQKQSDNMTRRRATTKQSNPYSRTRGGKRHDLNDQYFRSSWEANFARYLNLLIKNGDIIKWEYEPDTFDFTEIKRGIRSYTPDFKVFDTADAEPYYYEIKGWMDDKSKTRLKRMAKYHPDIQIIVFGQKDYRSLEGSLSALIPYWEV